MTVGVSITCDIISSGLPILGGLSEQLWSDAQVPVQQCLHHPFVAALAAGTLPRHTFQHYVLQDAFFLAHFGKAYAAALDKLDLITPSTRNSSSTSTATASTATAVAANSSSAGTQITNGTSSSNATSTSTTTGSSSSSSEADLKSVRDALSMLLLGVHQELQLHGSFAAKWGVDVSDALKPSPATAAYCSFLMEVAQDPQTTVAEVLAAMMPCSRLYGYLGCALAAATQQVGLSRHAYSEWVDTYSGAEYLACPKLKESVFDNLKHAVPYERLKSLYCMAMQLEVDFFSAQPGTPPARNIGLLVVDFDETCTEKDTIGVLLNAIVESNAYAAAAACASGNSAAAADHRRQELAALMKTLSANYVSKQQDILDRILAPVEAAAGVGTAGSSAAAAGGAAAAAAAGQGSRPFDEQGLRSFCEQLSDFDVAMNQVVIDAGALKGITADRVAAAAAVIQLRPGCRDTLAAAAAAGVPVSLLSVNWSTTLINAVMGLSKGQKQQQQGSAQQQQQQQQQEVAQVFANELEFGPDGFSTGQLQRQVQCGRDKLELLQQTVARHKAAAAAAAASGAVVYVGDSCSDILPFLEADFGIIIGQNKLLRRVLAAYGVQLLPLCAAPLSEASSSSSSSSSSSAAAAAKAGHVLYEASSWHEITAFLFGPTSSNPSSSTGGASSSSRSSRSYSSLVQVTTDRAAALAAFADPSSPSAAAAAATAKLTEIAAAGAAGRPAPPLVLTIAGSDCGGGAGIQADLKTIIANGGFGMSAITALTAQNSRGVQGVHLTPQDFLSKQLDSILSDLPPAAVKTGMLPNAAAVEAVAAKLRQYYCPGSNGSSGGSSGSNGSSRRLPPLVVDPVLISTSGHALAGGGVGAALRDYLAPLATMLTPNITEAEALWGEGHTISSVQDMEAAAQHLHSWGCQTVLIKGGHLAEHMQQQQQQGTDPSDAIMQVVDVLYDGHQFHYFAAPHINTSNTHGTGCTLAAAIATALAAGSMPVQAVAAAKGYLTASLAASSTLNFGQGPQHPFNHGFGLSSVTGLLNPVESQAAALQGLGAHVLNPVDLRVYVVTDAGCNEKAGRSLMEAVAGAVAGGATIVQLREKDIDGGDFLKEARAIVEYCRPLGIPVVINDRVDVAKAADADGVHVGQSDLPAHMVRKMLGPQKILGVSVKTPAEAAKALADGADYIGVGAVYPTGTKAASVIGVQGLRTVCDMSGLPVVAIGGVGVGNAVEVLAAGAQGLAVVSAVFAAPDVQVATRQLWEAVVQAQQQQQQQGQGKEEEEAEAAAEVAVAVGQ